MTNLHDIEDLVGLMSGDEDGAALVQSLPLLRISPDPDQPRTEFEAEALAQLAASISAQGVLQPIIVRPDPEHQGDFIIVAGERRYHAAGEAGLAEIPAMVRDLDDGAIRAIQLIENVDREPLSPLDEAQAIARMLGAGASGADLARLLGKSEGWVSLRKKVAGAATLLKPFRGLCSDIEALASLVDVHRYSPAYFSQFADGQLYTSRSIVRAVLRQLKAEAERSSTDDQPQLPGLPPQQPLATEGDLDLDHEHTEEDDEDNEPAEPPPPRQPKPRPLSAVLGKPDHPDTGEPDTERGDDEAPDDSPDDAEIMDLEARLGDAIDRPVIIDRNAEGRPVRLYVFVDSWADVEKLAEMFEKP